MRDLYRKKRKRLEGSHEPTGASLIPALPASLLGAS